MSDRPPLDYAEPTRREVFEAHLRRRRARHEHGLSVLKLFAFVALAVIASAGVPILLFFLIVWSSQP